MMTLFDIIGISAILTASVIGIIVVIVKCHRKKVAIYDKIGLDLF